MHAQRYLPVRPVPHTFQPLHQGAAGTSTRQEPGDVTRAITDERHAAARQGGEYHLAVLSGTRRRSVRRADDLEIEVGLAKVVAVMRRAIHSAPQAHFAGAVVLEHFTAPFLFQ